MLDVRTPVFSFTTAEMMLRLAQDIADSNDTRWTFWTWRLYRKGVGDAHSCVRAVPTAQDGDGGKMDGRGILSAGQLSGVPRCR